MSHYFIIANEQAEVAEQEAVCYLRNVHMSPFKVRRVLDCIRGKSYEECLIMLEFMPYKACEPILSALFSPECAKNNLGMNKANCTFRVLRRRCGYHEEIPPESPRQAVPDQKENVLDYFEDEGARLNVLKVEGISL